MNFGYVGATRSGKTTLASMVVAGRYAQGRQVSVLDRFRDPRWKCHRWFNADRPMEFLEFAQANFDNELVADEWGVTVPRGKKGIPFNWLGTSARHHGHAVHIMCHRWTQLEPALRDGLDTVFCFRQGMKSAQLLEEEFALPGLAAELVTYPRLKFIQVGRSADVRRGMIVFKRGKPHVVWETPAKRSKAA